MFRKVKAAIAAATLAALAGVGGYLADLDWGQFGSFGPAAGSIVTAAVAYAARELTGYGSGVPVPEDEIPGGAPLPTGVDGLG